MVSHHFTGEFDQQWNEDLQLAEMNQRTVLGKSLAVRQLADDARRTPDTTSETTSETHLRHYHWYLKNQMQFAHGFIPVAF